MEFWRKYIVIKLIESIFLLLYFFFSLNATKCQKYSITQVKEREREINRSGQTEIKNEHDNRKHTVYL